MAKNETVLFCFLNLNEQILFTDTKPKILNEIKIQIIMNLHLTDR